MLLGLDQEGPGARTETLRPEAGGPFSSGAILGERYRLGAFLGRGGMGEVWQAFDLKLRVDVALKSVRRERFEDDRALELLRREVRSAREVMSPNVCRIFDLVDVDGHELVSMEYIDGNTLTAVLRERGPLELREATEIASQFMAGLEAIHTAGLIHRDVKPENIMITRSGRVVLMDFGLAGRNVGRASLIAGTPAYMSPEQLRGDALDARTDIFAAGVVLAEMISADGIRDRASRESLQRGIREDPPRLPDSPWRPVLRQAVASNAEQRFSSARELIRALEEVTLRVEGAEDLRPYPGLASFTEDEAEYFFGREVEIEAVWKKLRRPHLLALIGPSGAGKTSFIRAGLLPATPVGWRCVVCHPGDAPIMALGRTLVPEFAGDTEAVGQMLRFDDADVAVSLFSRWRKRHDEALLIVDQFEELFTLNPPEIQARFAEILGRLALEANIHVLLSMREDFLFHCSGQTALTPIFSELTPLRPPAGVALRRAVVQPALKCGYRFEDAKLVEEILTEVETERGALPLLAFAAAQLWERRDRDNGVLTRAAYEEIGGVGGALAQHAEATLDKIGSDRISVVRELFRNLVTAQGTRAARDIDELLSVFEERQQAQEVLQALIDARLLTSFEYVTGEAEDGRKHRRVEIIHESLITAWPRLVRWRTQDADGAQQRDQLRQVASMWEERGHPEDLLWTGTSYKEFEVWRERYAGGLTETEEAFARAMTQQNEKRRRRRRIVVGTVIVLLLAVVGVIGTLWQKARGEALRADASNLFALGQSLLEDHPSGALAYATASLEREDNPEVREFLMQVLWRGPTAFGTEHLGEFPLSMNFSPVGNALAAGGWRGLHYLWQPDGSLSIQSLNYEERTESSRYEEVQVSPHEEDELVVVDFSADGKFHVSSSHKGIHIWSVHEARERFLDIQPWWYEVRGQRLLTFTQVGDSRKLEVQRWPLAGGEPEDVGVWERPAALGDELALLRFDVDPSGEWLAYSEGSRLYVLSLQETEVAPSRHIATAGAAITRVLFHPDGQRIATCERVDDSVGMIRLWPVAAESSAPLQSFQGRFPGFRDKDATRGRTIRFDPDGSWMALVTQFEMSVLLWDLSAPPGAEPLILRKGRGDTAVNSAAIHPAGTWLGSAGTTVSLWPLGRSYAHVLLRQTDAVLAVEFDPHGEWVASGSWDGKIRIWSLNAGGSDAGRILWDSATNPVHALAVSPDSKRIVGGLWDGTVVILPVSGGAPTELAGFRSPLFSGNIAFDSEGLRLAAGGGYKLADDAVIRVWDLESGEMQVLDPGDGKYIAGVQFAPEEHLLSGGPGGLRIWDLDTGTFELLTPEPAWGQVGPDGRHVRAARRVTEEDGGVRYVNYVYDLWEGTSRDVSTHQRNIRAWHPSGEYVVTADRGGVIQVEPTRGGEPHLLNGHEGGTQCLRVHPDGTWIASAGNDGTLRLWPMPEGKPFHTLPYDELLDRLHALTNFRAVPDAESTTGYRLDLAPFPGWGELPTW